MEIRCSYSVDDSLDFRPADIEAGRVWIGVIIFLHQLAEEYPGDLIEFFFIIAAQFQFYGVTASEGITEQGYLGEAGERAGHILSGLVENIDEWIDDTFHLAEAAHDGHAVERGVEEVFNGRSLYDDFTAMVTDANRHRDFGKGLCLFGVCLCFPEGADLLLDALAHGLELIDGVSGRRDKEAEHEIAITCREVACRWCQQGASDY